MSEFIDTTYVLGHSTIAVQSEGWLSFMQQEQQHKIAWTIYWVPE